MFYYKCNACNKTANAETTIKSTNEGVNDGFLKLINNFQLSENLQNLFIEQVKIILTAEKDNASEKKRQLTLDLNDLNEKVDLIEYRYAIKEISKEIYERQNQKMKESIQQKMKELNKVNRPLLTEVPKIKELSSADLKAAMDKGIKVIDTRNKLDFQNGFIPGSINIQ